MTASYENPSLPLGRIRVYESHYASNYYLLKRISTPWISLIINIKKVKLSLYQAVEAHGICEMSRLPQFLDNLLTDGG
jgi:hypothetical protein